MTNRDLARKILDFLVEAQVSTIVVCAGARNAPLVVALEMSQSAGFKVYSYFEERSAAFFALGLSRSQRRPVAVLTTSGTAAAELLPSAIEATYQSVPLIFITADRPKSYRGSGAPQAIEQVGIFSHYVDKCIDLDVHTDRLFIDWNKKKPLHLNVCFDEPLIENLVEEQQILISPRMLSEIHEDENRNSMVPAAPIRDPFVLIGSLPDSAGPIVADFILRNRVKVYAESNSQLRCDERLKPYLLHTADIWAKSAFKKNHFKSVIRIGGVPTLRFWRDLEIEFKSIPVTSFSDVGYSGLARSSQLYPLLGLHYLNIQSEPSLNTELTACDEQLQIKKMQLLKMYPLSEAAMTARLSRMIGKRPIYLGNSLPIRNWDQFTSGESVAVYANRGANGIDGQISTYLGWSESYPESYCLIGDLTALYDLAALGLATSLPSARRTLIIMNNGGGQIFQRVFKNEKFINPHQLNFFHLAAFWGWEYRFYSGTQWGEELTIKSHQLVEIKPDADQSKKFWSDWDEICKNH